MISLKYLKAVLARLKITELKPYGYKGFLIGENFMKTENAGQAEATDFIAQL
jgi:indole-3-glycerol phosphate synthase